MKQPSLIKDGPCGSNIDSIPYYSCISYKKHILPEAFMQDPKQTPTLCHGVI